MTSMLSYLEIYMSHKVAFASVTSFKVFITNIFSPIFLLVVREYSFFRIYFGFFLVG